MKGVALKTHSVPPQGVTRKTELRTETTDAKLGGQIYVSDDRQRGRKTVLNDRQRGRKQDSHRGQTGRQGDRLIYITDRDS